MPKTRRRTKYNRRPDSKSLYQRDDWKALRKQMHAKSPFCAKCGKDLRKGRGYHADHIVRHGGDLKTFLNPENIQILCHSCHSKKTARLDGGFGNRRGGLDIRGACDIVGNPTSREHPWNK